MTSAPPILGFEWPRQRATAPLLASALLLLAACGRDDQPAPAPAAIEVGVVRAVPAATLVSDELAGRVVAYRIAEIRPQVGGVIQRRLFEQGSEVRAGQPLFQINPAPFRADLASAAAALQRAEAALQRTRTQAERLRPLVEADAISRQSYDDAVAGEAQARAEVAQARADLQRKRLDLDFATVTSPINGRIDQAVITEGALAIAGGTEALATVQQIDQIYVDVRQPAARLQALRQVISSRSGAGAAVTILDSDGRPYAARGRLMFSGVSVDPGTGEVIARVLVPNPDRTLLPGMYVRARLPRLTLPQGISMPQQAISHDGGGRPQVSVVDGQGRVHLRPVTIATEIGGNAIISAGLRSGELVIVEGRDRVQPGTPVKPTPWRLARPTDKR